MGETCLSTSEFGLFGLILFYNDKQVSLYLERDDDTQKGKYNSSSVNFINGISS